MRRHLALFLVLFGYTAVADYGLIPEYQKLDLRFGLDFLSSQENFSDEGAREPMLLSTRETKLSSLIFTLNPEYGIADSFSLYTNLRFVSTSVSAINTQEELLSGSGLGDLWLGVKWTAVYEPIVTVDGFFKFPTGASQPRNVTDVALGDGNVDIGLKVHIGKAETEGVSYFASPGLMFRSGDYSFAALGDLSLRYDFPRAYLVGFLSGILSFSPTLLYDSSFAVHDAPGAGGSYLLLNGSPTGAFGGARVGFVFYEEWAVEVGGAASFIGNRYPFFINIGGAITTSFDFYKPPKKKRVREVPFETDGTDRFYEDR